MHDRRSAQSVCLAVCAQLGWCQMGKVAALLKTSVLASIMELPTNLGKASRLIAIHGMFNCEIFNYFHILDTIVYNALAYFFYSTCKNRRWICTTNQCSGTCSIYGDGHYRTFDEKRYVFSGNCEYSLVQV